MGQRYVALLRGINVGKGKRVSMDELRAALLGAGLTEVRTLLNSGNVVFTAPAPEDPAALGSRIEGVIEARTGVFSRVTLLTDGEVRAILAENPFPEHAAEASRLQVSVLPRVGDEAAVADLASADWGAERLVLAPRRLYTWCPGGVAESALLAAVAKRLKDGVTTRTWATFVKLDAALGAGG